MILVCDIGGTKSHFGLYAGAELVFERRVANADFADIAALIEALLATPGLPRDGWRRACFALAGPVADDGRSAQLTNLPWRVDAAELEARFGLPPLRLVNDFAAAAIGAVTAAPDQLVVLQAGQALDTAPRLVVGAGTGLGMAIVVPDGPEWRVLPGEGGHVGFPPNDEEQLELWHFLRRRHARVSWEHVVSGPGLSAIHAFLAGRHEDADPGTVGRIGMAQPGSVEGRALRLFASLYGAYAGDMALTVLPRGGVYLAGGIAGKIMPVLAAGEFVAAFNAKPPHAALAARMPIYAASDPQLALRGAARLA